MGIWNSKADQNLEELLSQYKTDCLIFSKSTCPFSKAAISLCEDIFPPNFIALHKVKVTVIEPSDVMRAALHRKTDRATLPNVYIRGVHIGGFDELSKMNRIPRI